MQLRSGYSPRKLSGYAGATVADGGATRTAGAMNATVRVRERMVRFRDWLRAHDADRDAYARAKRELAQRVWRPVQHYADAKPR